MESAHTFNFRMTRCNLRSVCRQRNGNPWNVGRICPITGVKHMCPCQRSKSLSYDSGVTSATIYLWSWPVERPDPKEHFVWWIDAEECSFLFGLKWIVNRRFGRSSAQQTNRLSLSRNDDPLARWSDTLYMSFSAKEILQVRPYFHLSNEYLTSS